MPTKIGKKRVYICPYRSCGAKIEVNYDALPVADWPHGGRGGSLDDQIAAHVEATARLRGDAIDEIISQHLDTSHPGWTVPEVVAERSANALSAVFGVGPGEMFAPTDIERLEVERLVAAALRKCIGVHGPITDELAMSAAKRVYGDLAAAGRIMR